MKIAHQHVNVTGRQATVVPAVKPVTPVCPRGGRRATRIVCEAIAPPPGTPTPQPTPAPVRLHARLHVLHAFACLTPDSVTQRTALLHAEPFKLKLLSVHLPQAPAPAPAPKAVHAEPVKKERAPVTDDALVALKNQLKRAQEAQATYSKFTQAQVGCTLLPPHSPYPHYPPLSLAAARSWPRVCWRVHLAVYFPRDHPCKGTNTTRWSPWPAPADTLHASRTVLRLRLQVDDIFFAAAEAANAARLPLAKMAVEETRMGVVEDKVRQPGGPAGATAERQSSRNDNGRRGVRAWWVFPGAEVEGEWTHGHGIVSCPGLENRLMRAAPIPNAAPPSHATHQVIKNHFASEFIYNKYKGLKTCGVIEEDAAGGIHKVAEPVGVIAGIVPTTNPTSTAIFKALLALKTRNALVLCPHPRAAKCTIAAAKIVHDAAVAAGGWLGSGCTRRTRAGGMEGSARKLSRVAWRVAQASCHWDMIECTWRKGPMVSA